MLKSRISPHLVCLASICLLFPVTQQVKADSLNLKTNQLTSYSVAQRKMSRLRFKLPKRGAPTITIGGGTRSGSKSVTAILPQKKLGLTASQSPVIFVYVPENVSKNADFMLTDEQGIDILPASETRDS